jgi:uncharacterized OB-fold protein
MSDDPVPQFRAALSAGRLTFQQCACGNRWLPPRQHCPQCLGADWRWIEASGRGTLLSWIVYRVAYDESVANRLPYNVAIVALEEGPRLITNIVDRPDGAGLVPDAPVERVFIRDGQEAPKLQFRLRHG